MYNKEQIDRYLDHIGFPRDVHPKDPLELLAELQKRQLERVPFENLSLHYSVQKVLSLDLNDLFEKVVVRGRGGYCMENNNFFGAVLRSLGFDSMYAAGRVSRPTTDGKNGAWIGWSHLVNLVKIDNLRYLVDVGHGTPCPTYPILLGGGIVDGIIPQQFKVDFTQLPQHSDPSQRLWVYSHRSCQDSPWVEAYCFTETEYFDTDFETMNLYPMTSPKSFFTQHVVAHRFLVDEETKELIGFVALFGNRIKKNIRGKETVMRTFQDEEERIETIDRWFRIRLSTDERQAIKGYTSELK
ncbi:hypothetical protein BGZ61DRAFT_594530 [Ilyonectria robusta]|uniref:uncharacterized protein n=1 Tax=Ilyonectria robusta TaxID=1079257 RepID=UPI001E8CCC20|nr:uncharacterized protein BGZ61DRAFT_594530 [Ilyonectria robusta]KAH8655913.1 hypothetical protein BGZ61DRAFT_594530 [Ilyonectria robusta]